MAEIADGNPYSSPVSRVIDDCVIGIRDFDSSLLAFGKRYKAVSRMDIESHEERHDDDGYMFHSILR